MRFSLCLILAIFVASCFNAADAKEEAVIKPYWLDKWQTAISKVKMVNALNPAKLRTQTTPDKSVLIFDPLHLGKAGTTKIKPEAIPTKAWETAIVRFNAGTKLEKLDTSPSSKWMVTFNQLKTTKQLKNVDETQAAKITETVAQEVAKDPSKWRHIKKIAEITFGAGLSVLIFLGLLAMPKQ
ncbi:RxLR effector protein [Phytophthora megakarya]|uniref:RxLR effector protein n=1 Tax=Phytophthora megakarya TaxID=4795 RepID=A0A225USH5_9STRA|nr:RxLR effector protein [Phytophthora megakarya]